MVRYPAAQTSPSLLLVPFTSSFSPLPSRTSHSRAKAEAALTAAQKAQEEARIARITAKEFSPSFQHRENGESAHLCGFMCGPGYPICDSLCHDGPETLAPLCVPLPSRVPVSAHHCHSCPLLHSTSPGVHILLAYFPQRGCCRLCLSLCYHLPLPFPQRYSGTFCDDGNTPYLPCLLRWRLATRKTWLVAEVLNLLFYLILIYTHLHASHYR